MKRYRGSGNIWSRTKAVFSNRSKSLNNLDTAGCPSKGARAGRPETTLFDIVMDTVKSYEGVKGSLHRFGYRNFCVNVYSCISVVRQ